MKPSDLAFALSSAVLLLAGCQDESTTPNRVKPVRVEKAATSDFAPTFTLTGEVRPRRENDLAFRTAGRIVRRDVDVGDHVTAGTAVARLDPSEQEADVRAAAATVASAQADLDQAQAEFDRQKTLFDRGFATRSAFEQAQQVLRVAQGSLEVARAQHKAALKQLTDTDLEASADGVITARYADAGQVVQAAQPIFTLAEDGPRDAVFDVQEAALLAIPEDLVVELSKVDDGEVTATGKVREISPTVDPGSGTVRVKIEIDNPPDAMTLGSAVSGFARLKARRAILLPAQALSSDAGAPSVWIVDPHDSTLSRRSVEVVAYETRQIVVSSGIEDGDLVVTEGARSRLPGQKVTIATEDRQ